MIAMCGGHFTGYFKELENRVISETLYLMDLWTKLHSKKKDSNDTGVDTEYTPIQDPEMLKAINGF